MQKGHFKLDFSFGIPHCLSLGTLLENSMVYMFSVVEFDLENLDSIFESATDGAKSRSKGAFVPRFTPAFLWDYKVNVLSNQYLIFNIMWHAADV